MNKGEYFVDIVEAYECANNAMFKDEVTQMLFQKKEKNLSAVLYGV